MFPTHDWQFWLATAAALGAALLILRSLLPRRGKPAKGKKTTLTVGGKTVE